MAVSCDVQEGSGVMTYTLKTLEAERMSLLAGEERGDVLAWLTSPTMGVIEREWDEDDS
jgi:hypothetical protein